MPAAMAAPPTIAVVYSPIIKPACIGKCCLIIVGSSTIMTRERLRIVHDLHDGLGGSLVRSLALVEQAGSPLSNERML